MNKLKANILLSLALHTGKIERFLIGLHTVKPNKFLTKTHLFIGEFRQRLVHKAVNLVIKH
jgi:hypothetical protein